MRNNKLTADQWTAARARWQGSPDAGFDWLAKEMRQAWGVELTRQAVSARASRHQWAKGGAAVAPLARVAQPAPEVAQHATAVAQREVASEVVDAPGPRRHRSAGTTGVYGSRLFAAPTPPSVHPVDLPPGQKPEGYVGRGRPSMYRPKYAQQLIDYFDPEPFTEAPFERADGTVVMVKTVHKFPTLEQFATSIGVLATTIKRWADEVRADGTARYPDFQYAVARAKEVQASLLLQGGMAGAYEPRLVAFALKNLASWRDAPVAGTEFPVPPIEEIERDYIAVMNAARARMLEVKAERRHLTGEDAD